MSSNIRAVYPTTSIGEMVETIVNVRRSGRYGEYLGCDAQGFETVRVDGMTFKVGRPDADGRIPVLHVESGTADLAEVDEELCYALDRTLQGTICVAAPQALH